MRFHKCLDRSKGIQYAYRLCRSGKNG